MDQDFDQYPFGGDTDAPDDGHQLFDEPVVQDGPGLFDVESEDPESPPAPEDADPAPAPPPSRPAREPGDRPEPPPSPLALYRRYRPETFAEVIGQEHVTVPLQRALDNNRVNHAYLFSGPRGCGKTSSARILARCLNCEQGPTSTPCGECRSCRDLARGGPGSIDVIEIDAASHGGVDDARDLRERAFFAPVQSRFKIYIVDEAHMVTTAGFNALLKLVEEPPPHTKFVFATTEPEKVIGTIRSRTHHYPFRLVPPRVLTDYLAGICQAEGAVVEQAALPLVVRAGAGSVRDSLSVLDQLLGGAGEQGVTYSQAAALLGYTPDSLLDDIMDAFAAGDAEAVFQTIDRVTETGQDPRRFAEDLLHRLRDLIIVAAVPEAATNGMLEVSDDQAQRLATQVAGMGQGELTRAAEVIATGLTGMRGTTAPRLHLELMCARVLLPGADADERGLHARMDRLERRVGMLGDRAEEAAPVANWADVRSEAPAAPSASSASSAPSKPEAAEAPAAPSATEAPAPAPSRARQSVPPRQRPPGPPAGMSAPAAEQRATRPTAAATARNITATELRRVWPEVLEEVKRRRRFTYMMLSQHAQVLDVSDGQLLLGFGNPGARENFSTSGSDDVLADSLIEVIGVEFNIQAVTSSQPLPDGAQPHPPQRTRPAPPGPPPDPSPPRAEPAARKPRDATGTPDARGPGEDQYQEVTEQDASVEDPHDAAAGLLTEVFGAEVIDTEDETG